MQIFMVADGSFVTKANRPAGDWFNPHVRFLAIVTLPNKSAFSISTKEWTLCIVGSSLLTSPQGFLQVASWNGKAFRFYQVSSIRFHYGQAISTDKDYSAMKTVRASRFGTILEFPPTLLARKPISARSMAMSTDRAS